MPVRRILASPSSSPPFYPWDFICDFKQIILKGCTCGLVNTQCTESQPRAAVSWGKSVQTVGAVEGPALPSAAAGLKTSVLWYGAFAELMSGCVCCESVSPRASPLSHWSDVGPTVRCPRFQKLEDHG